MAVSRLLQSQNIILWTIRGSPILWLSVHIAAEYAVLSKFHIK